MKPDVANVTRARVVGSYQFLVWECPLCDSRVAPGRLLSWGLSQNQFLLKGSWPRYGSGLTPWNIEMSCSVHTLRARSSDRVSRIFCKSRSSHALVHLDGRAVSDVGLEQFAENEAWSNCLVWGLNAGPTSLDYSTSTTTFIRAFRDPSDQVTNFIAESLLQILTSILWLAASLLHSDISIYS